MSFTRLLTRLSNIKEQISSLAQEENLDPRIEMKIEEYVEDLEAILEELEAKQEELQQAIDQEQIALEEIGPVGFGFSAPIFHSEFPSKYVPVSSDAPYDPMDY